MALEETVNLGRSSYPQRFGRYLLLNELGRGGMGIVFRARDEELGREVALKKILGDADIDLQRRFGREARAAAALQHPNIIQVHDVGEWNGEQFFTMELIEGVTLDKLVGKRDRDEERIREEVALLADIADAIAHAHRNGIIHRDIKPQNIMVREDGVPYISDFGLARPISSQTILTLSGDIVGTPQYMSPEQASGRPELITPAVDIYSLGAVLYHVLTGEPPFWSEKDDAFKIIDRVKSEDPEWPRRKNPIVPRDLETICLKALAKEPKRRYPTAEYFAGDLRNYLQGEPISARPPSVFYLMIRAARRHRLGLSAAAAIVGLMMSGGIWYVMRTHQENLSHSMYSLKRQEQARKFVEDARPFYDSLALMYRLQNPQQDRMESLRSRIDALLEDALGADPAYAPAHLMRGKLAFDEERFDEAILHFTKAIENDPSYALAYFERGRTRMEQLFLWRMGAHTLQQQEFRQIYEAALQDLRLSGLEKDLPLEAFYHRIIMLHAENRPQQVIEECSAQESILGSFDERIYKAWGDAYISLGQAEDAIECYDKALRLRPNFARVFHMKGGALNIIGRYEEAKEMFTKALELNPSLYVAYAGRANSLDAIGEYRAAIEDCTRALEIDPDMIMAYYFRGLFRLHEGDYAGSIEDNRIATSRDPYDDDAWSNLIRALDLNDQYDEALNACKEGQQYNIPNPYLCEALLRIQRAMEDGNSDNLDEVISLYNTALELAVGKQDNDLISNIYYNRAETHKLIGELEEAKADYDAALSVNPNYYQALNSRAQVRGMVGDLEGKIQDCTAAIEIDPEMPDAYANLAMAYIDMARQAPGHTNHRIENLNKAMENFNKALQHAPPEWPYTQQLQEMLEGTQEILRREGEF